MKPIIGITVDPKFEPENTRTQGTLSLKWNYSQMVAEAGGVPILISPHTDLNVVKDMIHGWLIPGGDDMDAKHFGEENHPKAQFHDPSRWEMESGLYDILPDEMPVLGICYGCQFLNVKRGGTLIQHVPDVVEHEEHSSGELQKYVLDPSSQLAQVSGFREISGRSYHHQALGRVGDDLTVVAKAADGIIEAVEDRTKPFVIGLQWHPERTPDDPATRNVFRAFVEAASAYANKGL